MAVRKQTGPPCSGCGKRLYANNKCGVCSACKRAPVARRRMGRRPGSTTYYLDRALLRMCVPCKAQGRYRLAEFDLDSKEPRCGDCRQRASEAA